MRIRYSVGGRPYELGLPDSDDVTALCSDIEKRLRAEHAELSGSPYLTERVADALLNGLAVDTLEADLGELT